MTRESTVFIFGVLLILVPHLGVPDTWKFYFYLGCGVLLMILGYSLRRSAYLRSLERGGGERQAESFVEHHPHHE